MTEPKYREVFPEFIETLRARMEQGFKEYGDKSFERSGVELLEEIEQEVLDICGWSVVVYNRIRKLKELIRMVEND